MQRIRPGLYILLFVVKDVVALGVRWWAVDMTSREEGRGAVTVGLIHDLEVRSRSPGGRRITTGKLFEGIS